MSAGGKRQGAGRRPVDEQKKAASIRIYPTEKDALKARGLTIQKLLDKALEELFRDT